MSDSRAAASTAILSLSTPDTDERALPTGVTAARGFRASGVHCGIRRKRPDLALIVSDRPASAAAVFTTNLVAAAPVLVCRQALAQSHGRARAVVVNAGNANACTGERGMADARDMVARTAALLGLPVEEVLVASTGVIGQPLPIDRIRVGLLAAAAALSSDGGADAAEAILTTDLRQKEAGRRVTTAQGSYVIGAMAKGSGMIHPNMATTLAFVTTDAEVAPAALQGFLRRAADRSFNRISVDGDTSTNDTITALANGAAGVAIGADEADGFEQALTEVLVELARMVVRDGEGASKLVNVEVTGARSEAEALQVSRTIASSPLVKTAVHGCDPNWGRIVAAAGRSGVALDPALLRVAIGPVVVLSPGYVCDFSEKQASEHLRGEEVTLSVDLGQGPAAATTWTCDLSAAYVAINASYRT